MIKESNVWYSEGECIYEGNDKGIIIGKNGMGKTYIIYRFFKQDEKDELFESEELFDEEQNLINSSKLVEFLNDNPINRIFIVIKYDRNATMKEWLKQYMLCFRNYKENISVIVTFCPSEDMISNWNEVQRGVLKFYGIKSLCMVEHVDQNVEQVNSALHHLMKQKQQILIDINQTKLKELSNDIISQDLMQLQQLVGQIQSKGQAQEISKSQQQALIYPQLATEQPVDFKVQQQQIQIQAKQGSQEEEKLINYSQVVEKKEAKQHFNLKDNQDKSQEKNNQKSQQSSQIVPPQNQSQKKNSKRECCNLNCIIF